MVMKLIIEKNDSLQHSPILKFISLRISFEKSTINAIDFLVTFYMI